jgi:hypothetical protein
LATPSQSWHDNFGGSALRKAREVANPYRIYLGNPTGMHYWWSDLVIAVRDLFLPVIEQTKYDAVSVHSTMTAPVLRPTDLLVYVVQSASMSLVAPAFGATSGSGGTTAWDSKHVTGSEVYTYNNEPTEVAFLIFHEALHNKLKWSDKALHALGGLGGSPVNPPQLKSDVRHMRQGLSSVHPQWLGGWRSLNDPLRGL